MNNRFLQSAFEKMVVKHPSRIAIVDKERDITYQELNNWSNAIACLLVERGINEGDRVAILSERSISLVAAMLATLKAGAAYVPLDPSYPADRLNYCIDKAEVNLIITDGSMPEVIDEQNVIYLKEVVNLRTDQPPVKLKNIESPAYIIFTSGSTGRPKGVVISHRAIVNHMDWMNKEFSWTENDVFLQKTASGFDASVWEIYAPLSAGATMVIGSSNPFDIAMDIERHDVTVVQFVPTVLKLLSEQELLSKLKSLRILFCGGESLSASLVNHVQSILSIPIVNLYGPTEAAIDTTFRVCLPGESHLFREISLGSPITNVSVDVVDEKFNIMGPGNEGELLISGEGLALGYYGLPEITKDRFVIHPSTGQLSYLTGDLVYIRENGEYEFRGRKDLQVKLRGLRIELGEIEETIREVPFVKDTVVEVREEEGEQWLVSYIRCHYEDWDDQEVREYLKSKLPSYMIPNFFIPLTSFPYLENGKLDRRKLSKIPFRTVANYDNLQNESEHAIAKVWSELLGEKINSATTTFAALGGHSLLAIRLTSRLSAIFHVKLPHGFVFLYPTIREQAKYLNRLIILEENNQSITSNEKITSSKIESGTLEASLSLGQQGILFFEQEKASSSYHIAFLLNFIERGNAEIVEEAIIRLRRRHPILASRITTAQSGEYVQMHDESLNSALIHYSTSEEQLRKAVKSAAEEKFDFENEGGFRAVLFSTEKAEYLLLTFHHLIADGWSTQLFIDELHEMIEYNLKKSDEINSAFFQFAKNQQTMNVERGLEFWKQYLDHIPDTSRFPMSQMKDSLQTMKGKRIKFSITKELEQKLSIFSQNSSLTDFSIHFAAAASVLAKRSGQRDICIGVPVANRSLEEDLDAIGNYVNVVPFRMNFTEKSTLQNIAKRIANDYADLIKYEHIPIETIIPAVTKHRNRNYRPLFQIMFVYNRFLKKQPYSHFEVKEVLGDTTKCDLSFGIEYDGNRPTFTIEYCDNLFEEKVIVEIKNEWISQMEKIAGESVQVEIYEQKEEINTIAKEEVFHADEETLKKVQHILEGIFVNVELTKNSNFFEVGGHSLLAMKFIAQINKEFDISLPVSIIFDYPTIQGIAHVITNSIKPNGVVHISPAEGLPKMWFIHPAGGALWCYKEMATELNEKFDVWGIESAELETGEFENDLLSLAKRYASHILAVQPQGPYYIAGYSFGGNVAFEIARSFEAEGEEVGLLTLLDCHLSKPREFDEMEFIISYASKFTNGANDKFQPDELALMKEEELFAFLLDLGKIGGHLHKDADLSEVKKGLGIWQANNVAIHRYSINAPFHGKVLFIRAEENEQDTTIGWETYLAGDLTVCSVPAHHFTIYKSPNAEKAARIIMEQVTTKEYV